MAPLLEIWEHAILSPGELESLLLWSFVPRPEFPDYNRQFRSSRPLDEPAAGIEAEGGKRLRSGM